MRMGLFNNVSGDSNYEIRNIIFVAEKLQELGIKINLENIGDPIAKGEMIPAWMKDIVANIALQDDSYGYCPSQGLMETRKYLADRNNRRGGTIIKPQDIIFFNGLGDAIGKIYGSLPKSSRVIMPSPTYTAHSTIEASHSGQPNVVYPLDPYNHWYPDVKELRRIVGENPDVVAILLVNPDNPTGMVYSEEILREIIEIVREFDLFVIIDEIYENLIFENSSTLQLCEIIGDIPGIAMKGISKELPWPGSRCGWIEVYNREKDPVFSDYIKRILNSKILEVCSTTLPQKAIPLIFEHPEYSFYLMERRRRYERLSDISFEMLKNVPGITINRANGAFYMSLVFENNILTDNQKLPIENENIRRFLKKLIAGTKNKLDKIFVYYLLAATGICMVPLSSFNTDLLGVRFTLLETDETSFISMVKTLARSICVYIESDSPIFFEGKYETSSKV